MLTMTAQSFGRARALAGNPKSTAPSPKEPFSGTIVACSMNMETPEGKTMPPKAPVLHWRVCRLCLSSELAPTRVLPDRASHAHIVTSMSLVIESGYSSSKQSNSKELNFNGNLEAGALNPYSLMDLAPRHL